MVLQRTIENLRERPKDERRAVALGGALAVMIILFLGWAVFFFRSVGSGVDIQQVNDAYTLTVGQAQEAYDSTGWVSGPHEAPSGSSGPVQLIEEMAATSSAQ